MTSAEAIAGRYLASIERRSAATQRLVIERTPGSAEDYLSAMAEEARARRALLDTAASAGERGRAAGQAQPA